MSLRRMLVLAFLLGVTLSITAFVGAPNASAHPLGNFTVNRYGGLVLSPGQVHLRYVLDMAEIPAFQEGSSIDTNGDGAHSPAERETWARSTAAALLAGLRLSVGAREVPLRLETFRLTFPPGQAGLDTLRLEVDAVGTLPESGSMSFEDTNYSDRIGWKEITISSEGGLALAGSSVPSASPSDELRTYPADRLSSPLDVRSASASFRPGVPAAGSTPTPARTGAVSPTPATSGNPFARLVTWRLTPLVLVLSLLVAFGFGALHALGPGHGKTITAAYLVGTGARVGQAAVVGIAVALMHTASVLGLGLALFVLARSFPPDRVYPWLTLATGVVAIGLGAGLALSRARAARRGEWHAHGHIHPWDSIDPRGGATGSSALLRLRPGAGAPIDDPPEAMVEPALSSVLLLERDAVDPEPEHPHRHDRQQDQRNDHALDPARPVSGRGLLALAVAGGILPSPTAFVVLTGAISAHRAGYGLALIAAFSLGLAASLMAVGVLAVRARSAVSSRLDSRVGGVLPILSAMVILGFGVFFAVQGIRGLA